MRDLFFYILRKWRLIVCMSIICGGILGGFRGYQLLSMIRSREYQEQARILYEQALEWREDETERLDEEIADLQKKLEEKQRYMDSSFLMQMDPYNSIITSVDLCIFAEENIKLLYEIYQLSFKSGSITGRMAELLGEDELYLRELITIQDSIWIEGNDDSTETDAITLSDKAAVLHIELLAADHTSAQKMKDSLMTSIDELNSKLNGMVNTHELVQIDHGCVRYSGEELENYQNEIRSEIVEMSQLLEQTYKEKEALEIPIYELMPMRTVFLSSLKYAVAGGLAGGCLSIVILYILCLHSEKILSPEELKKRTGLNVLAISGKTKKSLGAIIDSLIIHKELEGSILSLESVRKRLELEICNEEYAIWGELPEDMAVSIFPQNSNSNFINMEQKNSWLDMTDISGQEQYEDTRRYVLIVDRKKDTYKGIENKLDTIHRLHGNNIICIICV